MRIRAHEHEHSHPRTRVLLTSVISAQSLGQSWATPRVTFLDAWKHRSERHLQLNIYVISYSKYRYII